MLLHDACTARRVGRACVRVIHRRPPAPRCAPTQRCSPPRLLIRAGIFRLWLLHQKHRCTVFGHHGAISTAHAFTPSLQSHPFTIGTETGAESSLTYDRTYVQHTYKRNAVSRSRRCKPRTGSLAPVVGSTLLLCKRPHNSVHLLPLLCWSSLTPASAPSSLRSGCAASGAAAAMRRERLVARVSGCGMFTLVQERPACAHIGRLLSGFASTLGTARIAEGRQHVLKVCICVHLGTSSLGCGRCRTGTSDLLAEESVFEYV